MEDLFGARKEYSKLTKISLRHAPTLGSREREVYAASMAEAAEMCVPRSIEVARGKAEYDHHIACARAMVHGKHKLAFTHPHPPGGYVAYFGALTLAPFKINLAHFETSRVGPRERSPCTQLEPFSVALTAFPFSF